MYFKATYRRNPVTGETEAYYRLVMSYRNASNSVCQRPILTLGYAESGLSVENLNEISRALTDRYMHKAELFKPSSDKVKYWIEELWLRIVRDRKLDLSLYAEDSRHISTDTMRHEQVREIGAEWLAYNTWNELGLSDILRDAGFNPEEIKLAQTQVISRAINPASELATCKIIKENSAICQLTGYPIDRINKDKLYRSSHRLYEHKATIEKHLTKRTNDIFNIEENLLLFDLTNSYFEGAKRSSTLAQFGRSKEKRKDAKLVVLAMAINTLGFIRHSSIHEGNFADSSDITFVLDNLIHNTGSEPKTVVLDAGIATADNLNVITGKGYNYICVSRSQLSDYEYESGSDPVRIKTNSGKVLTLKKVKTQESTEEPCSYFFEINSPDKALKEKGIKTRFELAFEEELEKARKALSKPRGMKKTDKVHQRIGRIRERFASTHRRYQIDVITDTEKGIVTDITWSKIESKESDKEKGLGRYFLRTNMDMKEDCYIWHVYNLIRDIEDAFRTLKSDLDLRPIYHKNDDSTKAHLHLGLLAYWLVNTIRCKLKHQKITYKWREVLRIASTQKFVTTTGRNAANNEITVRKCSEPTDELKKMQQALGIKPKPNQIESKCKDVVLKSG